MGWDLIFSYSVYFLMLAPVYLSSSLSLYFILAVRMGECLGKHSCMCSTFPVAIFYVVCIFSRGEIMLASAEASHVKTNQSKLNLCLIN